MASSLTAAINALKDKPAINQNGQTDSEEVKQFILTNVIPSLAAKMLPTITWKEVHQNEDELQTEAKKLRLAANLTQRDVAKITGLSQTTIARAEKYGTSHYTWIKIAIALGKKITIS